VLVLTETNPSKQCVSCVRYSALLHACLTSHASIKNRLEQMVSNIVQHSTFMCFLNTASIRLFAHSISFRLMTSLKGNKVSRAMRYVIVFTAAIKTRHSPLEFILEFRRS
jgi:hypothetical protein